MSKYIELVNKLRDIFQINRPELDFGIYRILNARAGEINHYLEHRLKEKVQVALADGNAANIDQLKEDLKKAEKAAEDAGFNPSESPKVKEIKTKIAQAISGNAEHENAVFSHLLTFFSRYYDNGDFISQRRYKGDTYAIPYAGEEVMLHWANKDQYYTKSGENFANYSFKLGDGRLVHFRLTAADTAKDNRKDNEKDRRFALVESTVVTRVDDQGGEYDEQIIPVEEVDGKSGKELIIRFEYKAVPKGTKQEALIAKAVEFVLGDVNVKARWLDLNKRAPTDSKPQRTLLEKHLTDYTQDAHPQYPPVVWETYRQHVKQLPAGVLAEGRGGVRSGNRDSAPTDPKERLLKPACHGECQHWITISQTFTLFFILMTVLFGCYVLG